MSKAPLILNSAVIASGQVQGPAILSSGKKSPVTIEQEAGWAQRRCGRHKKEKNLFLLSAIEPGFLDPEHLV
jgi:hypothetical protein